MRVWLINPGEPLPSDSRSARLLRTAQLAEALVARGHDVVYWSGNFDHVTKRNRFPSETVLDHRDRYQIRLLDGLGYSTTTSLRRIAHHYYLAHRFTRSAPTLPPPDLIYSTVGPVETCVAAAKFARPRGIPLVLDIRDLWPDVLLDLVPRWARGPGRLVLWPMFRGIRYACSRATGIIVTSPGFLDWGVAYANRPKCPLDRYFPQARESQPPREDLLEGAGQFWKGHGINGAGTGLVACFFGSLGRHFEIPTVIEAARRLRKHGRQVRFVLCGTGDNLPRYRQMAEGVDNVVFPGWVGLPEIWSLMRMASVGLAPYVASPNWVDNLTTKPIEYLSAGLPVIASRETKALCELLDRNQSGVAYENGNAEHLAEVLAALDDDRERLAELSTNAKALYESQFTTETVFGQMVDHFERIKDSVAGKPRLSQGGNLRA